MSDKELLIILFALSAYQDKILDILEFINSEDDQDKSEVYTRLAEVEELHNKLHTVYISLTEEE